MMNRVEQLYEVYLSSNGVETDTRKPLNGKIFFALKGENFNGNVYASAALKKGAKCAVIDDPNYVIENTFLVEDVLKTMQALGLHHRRTLGIPIIAITGSNGKTTTKELMHRVLSKKYKTTATRGNLNNHIGVPLTLLAIPKGTEYGIIEMGANHIGEIQSYCEYTEPNYGLITNIGKAHLEGFGSIDGVIQGKGELYDFLRESGGEVFVNSESTVLMNMSESIKRYTYASHEPADLIGNLVLTDTPYLSVMVQETQIDTQMTGDYNLPNILAALCVGQKFEVSINDMQEAISGYVPDNSRSQVIQKGKNTIILDAYNANPTSMEVALENFASMDGAPKLVLIGEMNELGEESEVEHQNIINKTRDLAFDTVILVGPKYANLDRDHMIYFKSNAAAGEYVAELLADVGHHILIKGSRSAKMEEILNYI